MVIVREALHFYLALCEGNPMAATFLTGLVVLVIAAVVDSWIFERNRRD